MFVAHGSQHQAAVPAHSHVLRRSHASVIFIVVDDHLFSAFKFRGRGGVLWFEPRLLMKAELGGVVVMYNCTIERGWCLRDTAKLCVDALGHECLGFLPFTPWHH